MKRKVFVAPALVEQAYLAQLTRTRIVSGLYDCNSPVENGCPGPG